MKIKIDLKKFKKDVDKLNFVKAEGQMYIRFFKGYMLIIDINGNLTIQSNSGEELTVHKIKFLEDYICSE